VTTGEPYQVGEAKVLWSHEDQRSPCCGSMMHTVVE